LCKPIEDIESESFAVIKNILSTKGLSKTAEKIDSSLQLIDAMCAKISTLELRSMRIAISSTILFRARPLPKDSDDKFEGVKLEANAFAE
jgi:hypothetical protein